MSFCWQHYLALAKILQSHGQLNRDIDEAAFRSSISRCYFAAFCYVRNFTRDNQQFQPKYDASDHGALRANLKMRRRFSVATKLDKLRQNRNISDYQDVVEGIGAKLQESIDKAEKIFSMPI